MLKITQKIRSLIVSNKTKRDFTGHLRLVDDSHNIQSSNGSSILGGLALGIIEVGRNSDHSMCDLGKKLTLSN